MDNELYYKRLLIARDKLLLKLLHLESLGEDKQKIKRVAKQLLKLNEVIKEIERQAHKLSNTK